MSLVLATGVAELVLRAAVPAPAPIAGVYRFFEYHPRHGWDLKPNTQQRLDAPSFDVEVRINAQGMRDDRNYALVAPAERGRMVVLGDSFAFGHGVDVEDGFVALLAEALAPAEVLNWAVTGYGTDQQLLKLLDDAVAYRPDRVLVAMFEGGVFRNTRDIQMGYPKPRFELDGRTLRLINVPVPRLTRSRGWGFRSALGHLALPPLRAAAEHAGFGSAWPVTEAIVRRFAEACTAAGAELTFAILPKNQAVEGTGVRRRLHRHTLSLIDAMLERTGVDRLNLTPALTAAWASDPSTPLYYPRDGHWTAAGHQVAAAALVDHFADD